MGGGVGAAATFLGGLVVGVLVQSLRAGRKALSSKPPVEAAKAAPWQQLRTVSPPHPGWKPGDAQPSPYPNHNEFITLDPCAHDKPSMYALCISTVVPRPVAFISSCDVNGNVNLAPYSYFNAVCHNPFTIVVGVNHNPSRPHGKKDTLNNILATKEFVVNIISEWFAEAANHTCGDYPPEVDEMKLSGLTQLASEKVRAPRVAESAVQMECTLAHTHELHDAAGKATCTIVVGTVVALHVSRAVAGTSPTGKLVVDITKLLPVSRCGGVTYARSSELYDIGRPDSKGVYPPPPAPPAPKVSS